MSDHPGAGNAYQVGIATADITPRVGSPLSGFTSRGLHTSIGIYHPLRAVATVVDDGTSRTLLVSIEWLGCYDGLPGRIRRSLSAATGIPESHISLVATHTHCGPAIRDAEYGDHGFVDEDYLADAIVSITRAGAIAARNTYPASLSIAIGRSPIAMSRRRPDPDRPGRVLSAMRPYPAGTTDHDLGALVIRSTGDDVVRGVLFSYACHPTSRGGMQVGGDYVGFTYDYLAEAFPLAQFAFFQGCGGDQKPGPVDPGSDVFGSRTIDETRDLGFELGHDVASAVEAGTAPILGTIKVRRAVEMLETEPVTRDALERELRQPTADFRRQWARTILDRLDRGHPSFDHVPFEIQTITFGTSLAIIAFAGEMSAEHGLRLKRELHDFSHVLPFGYANQMVGYVPVRRQFSEYGYEVLDGNQRYNRTGRYVESTEDQIHDCVARLLRS